MSAVGWSRLHKAHHLFTLHQPAANFGLEHWLAARRTQAFAMDDAHTAQAGLLGLAQEFANPASRLVAAQAMQVEFGLNRPSTAS